MSLNLRGGTPKLQERVQEKEPSKSRRVVFIVQSRKGHKLLQTQTLFWIYCFLKLLGVR